MTGFELIESISQYLTGKGFLTRVDYSDSEPEFQKAEPREVVILDINNTSVVVDGSGYPTKQSIEFDVFVVVRQDKANPNVSKKLVESKAREVINNLVTFGEIGPVTVYPTKLIPTTYMIGGYAANGILINCNTITGW